MLTLLKRIKLDRRFSQGNNDLLYIIKNSMQMNNDYIGRNCLDVLDDMIDDDHVLRLMWRYVDNQYNRILEILGIDDVLIDVQ